jgi:hypothetical protein
MMLRQCLASAVAMANLIPTGGARSLRPINPSKCSDRNSYLSKTDARTLQIPIDRSAESEPLPARDFVPWRFSDVGRRSGGFVMQASEKPAQEPTFLDFALTTLILGARLLGRNLGFFVLAADEISQEGSL